MNNQECDEEKSGQGVPTYACWMAGVPVPEPRYEHADSKCTEKNVRNREFAAGTVQRSNPQELAKQPTGYMAALRHMDPHQRGEQQTYKDVDEKHRGLEQHGDDAADYQTEVHPPSAASGAPASRPPSRLSAQSRYARVALRPRLVLQIAVLTAIAIAAP